MSGTLRTPSVVAGSVALPSVSWPRRVRRRCRLVPAQTTPGRRNGEVRWTAPGGLRRCISRNVRDLRSRRDRAQLTPPGAELAGVVPRLRRNPSVGGALPALVRLPSVRLSLNRVDDKLKGRVRCRHQRLTNHFQGRPGYGQVFPLSSWSVNKSLSGDFSKSVARCAPHPSLPDPSHSHP